MTCQNTKPKRSGAIPSDNIVKPVCSSAKCTAEIAVMGPEGAVAILYRRELEKSDDPAAMKKELAAKYRKEIANPYVADERGFIDEVIDPAETRLKLVRAFEALETKFVNNPARKHGNIPL